MDGINWKKMAINLLKAEIVKKGLSYEDLSQALLTLGVKKTPNNIGVTINRGTFSFIFVLQCSKAIGIDLLRLSE